MTKNVYTLGQVAKMLGLAEGTIRRMCDIGYLEFYQVPNSKHRRITKQAILKFSQLHSFPLLKPFPDEATPPSDELCVSTVDTPNLHLDVKLEKARALHRVWRALNDGECPACGVLSFAEGVWRWTRGQHTYKYALQCPHCYFYITWNEIDRMSNEFAPVMQAAIRIFDEWRGEVPEDVNVSSLRLERHLPQ